MDSRERLHARGHVHGASDEVILHPLARAHQADKPQTSVNADPQSKPRQPLPPELDIVVADGRAHRQGRAHGIVALPRIWLQRAELWLPALRLTGSKGSSP